MKKTEFEKIDDSWGFWAQICLITDEFRSIGHVLSFTSFYLCLLLFIKVNILQSGIDKTETVFCFINFFITWKFLEIK